MGHDTDSTIRSPPQKNGDFFSLTNVSWLLINARKGAMKKTSQIFSCLQRTTTTTTTSTIERSRRGGKGAPLFRRYGRELVSETGDFVTEKAEGANRRTTHLSA